MDLDRTPTALLDDLHSGAFPRRRWRHDEHLTACWAVQHELRELDAVVDAVRDLIASYNLLSTPVERSVRCHETITRYYVEAVHRLDAAGPTDLFAHPWCARSGPEAHWSPEVLWSDAAWSRWVEPDLAPLPWAGRTPTT
jgi:hypothetical protein